MDTCTALVYGAFSRGSHIFYMKVDSGRRIQRYAWFNSGYMRAFVYYGLGFSRIFSVKVDSDPVVVDVLVGRLSSSTGAVCVDAVVGVLIWCTGRGPGLTPAIRAEKGWRGRRELAPRRSATQINCMHRRRVWRDTHVVHSCPHHHHHQAHPGCISFL